MSQEILQRLTRIETMVESLVGNGQPGRIKQIEDDVKGLRESRSQSRGFNAGVSAAISAAISVAGSWLFTHLFSKP